MRDTPSPLGALSRCDVATGSAALVLGNAGTVEDTPVLRQASNDPEPLVREHAAWALGRLRTETRTEEPCAAAG